MNLCTIQKSYVPFYGDAVGYPCMHANRSLENGFLMGWTHGSAAGLDWCGVSRSMVRGGLVFSNRQTNRAGLVYAVCIWWFGLASARIPAHYQGYLQGRRLHALPRSRSWSEGELHAARCYSAVVGKISRPGVVVNHATTRTASFETKARHAGAGARPLRPRAACLALARPLPPCSGVPIHCKRNSRAGAAHRPRCTIPAGQPRRRAVKRGRPACRWSNYCSSAVDLPV